MFKVGQNVVFKSATCEIQGIVNSIDDNVLYPILVRLDTGEEEAFTDDGKLFLFEYGPSLFIIKDNEDRTNDLLHDASLQLEYLSEKFWETGAINALISRIKTYLNEA